MTDYRQLSHYRLLNDATLVGLEHVDLPAEHLAAIVIALQDELSQLRRTVAHLRLDIDRLNSRPSGGDR